MTRDQLITRKQKLEGQIKSLISDANRYAEGDRLDLTFGTITLIRGVERDLKFVNAQLTGLVSSV